MRALIPIIFAALAVPANAADLTLRYPPDGATIGTSDGIPIIADADGSVTSITLDVDGFTVTTGAWNQTRIALRTGPIIGAGAHVVTLTAVVDGQTLVRTSTVTATVKSSWSRIPLRLMPLGGDGTSVVRAIAAGYAAGNSGGIHPVVWTLPADPAGLSLPSTDIDLTTLYPALVGADTLAVEATGRCAGVAWHTNVGGAYTASVWRRDANGTVTDLGVVGSSMPLSSLPTKIALLADGSVGSFVMVGGYRHAALFAAGGGGPLDLHGTLAATWGLARGSEIAEVTPDGHLVGKAWRDAWEPRALVVSADHGTAAVFQVGDQFADLSVRGIAGDGRVIYASTGATDTKSFLMDAATGTTTQVAGNGALARADFAVGGYAADARYAGDGADSTPGEVISGVWNPIQDEVRYDQWRAISDGAPGAWADPVRSVVAVGAAGSGRWDAPIAIGYDGYVSAFARSAQAAILVRALPPTITLTAPTHVAADAAVTVTATASDPDLALGGGLGGVLWYLDGGMVAGQNTTTLSLPGGLSAGSHTIYARTGNTHGLISTSATSTVSALTQPIAMVTPVTATPTRGPISATIGWTEPVTGFAANDLSVTNASVSALSGSGDAFSVTLTPTTTSGTVTLSVAAGSVTGDITAATNPVSATTSWVVDQVPPALAITSAPARTANTTPTVTGTTEIGAVLAATVDGSAVTAPTVNGDGTWTLTLPAQADGAHIVSVVASDSLGNTSAPETVAITTDTTGPATAPTVVLTLTAATHSVTASGTAPAGAVSVRLSYGGISQTVAVAGDGSWTATLAGVADGGLTVSAVGLDDLGNAGPQGSANMQVDTVPPVVLVVRDQPLVRGGSTASWTVTLGANGEAATRDLTGKMTFAVTGSVITDVPVVTTPADAAWKRVVTVLVSGSGTVALTVAAGSATDTSGNASAAASAPDPTSVDGQAPIVAITTPGQVADLGDFGIAVSADENLSVSLAMGSITVTNGTLSAFTATGGNGWSATLSPTGSPVTVSVAAGAVVDQAGNPSAAAGPATVVIVPGAPRATARPTISGGSSCGLLLTVVSDPASWIVGAGLVPSLTYEWLVNGTVIATGSTFRPARPTYVGAMLVCRATAAARLPDGSVGPSASILSDPITLGVSAVVVSDVTIAGTVTVPAAIVTSGATVIGNGASWQVMLAPGGSTTVTATSEGGSDVRNITLTVTENPVSAQ